MSSYEEPQSPLSVASSGPLAPAPVSAQVSVRQPSRALDQDGGSGRDAPSLCERFLPSDPTKWNVEEVYEFIRSLPGQETFFILQEHKESSTYVHFAQKSWFFFIFFLLSSHSLLAGCQEIADEFRSQEIDGQALLLLKEDHLMSTMNIKLGPALKIFARINMLKDS